MAADVTAPSPQPLPRRRQDGTIQPEIADASDATVAGSLLDRYEPEAAALTRLVGRFGRG